MTRRNNDPIEGLDPTFLTRSTNTLTGYIIYERVLKLDDEISEFETLLRGMRVSKVPNTDWEEDICKDSRPLVRYNYSRFLELRNMRNKILSRTYHYEKNGDE